MWILFRQKCGAFSSDCTGNLAVCNFSDLGHQSISLNSMTQEEHSRLITFEWRKDHLWNWEDDLSQCNESSYSQSKICYIGCKRTFQLKLVFIINCVHKKLVFIVNCEESYCAIIIQVWVKLQCLNMTISLSRIVRFNCVCVYNTAW